MRRKKSRKKNKKASVKRRRTSFLNLPREVKYRIFCVITILLALVFVLSFFDAAGAAGGFLKSAFIFLVGDIYFILPLFLVLGGLAFCNKKLCNAWQIVLAVSLLVLGTAGLRGAQELSQKENFGRFILSYSGKGGWFGNVISWPLLKIFGFWVTQFIFIAIVAIGGLVVWHFLYIQKEKEENKTKKIIPQKLKKGSTPTIKEVFQPKFKVREIDYASGASRSLSQIDTLQKKTKQDVSSLYPFELKTQPVEFNFNEENYEFPSLDLVEKDRGTPTSGDIKVNSAIIKRTLQNFDIQVEMSGVNIGPTVTQYTLKPAAGIKLSKITSLANDLSLALAAHPIRIEAPIPGRPLVGIEIPNKSRTLVRMGNLISHPRFQNSMSPLTFALGRDVSGEPFFADLAHMPHLLVAGSTGAGKTVCLNSIILSFLYRSSPQILRLVLIDPKRVEFPVYNGLPHLLVPAIVNTQKAVNTLKWLVQEMERRFEVLSARNSRDIISYNEAITKEGLDPIPYIVLIIDELADLMAARGKDIEMTIVRLAQMARAVGIHLIVATQRPSVEIITGLIKANITSRIAFQVASQVDSRTILDVSGAEMLLGSGDMLFISSDIAKPKRIQGVYVSEKEVKKVVNFIKTKSQKTKSEEDKDELSESLEKNMDGAGKENGFLPTEEDPLYDDAKKVVIEAKKASASLLQRRLRVGYARAARLIDMLEERGVVGPGEGAKPREVYFKNEEESGGWRKI